MIEAAEKEGKLKRGDTLIEVSSGNTGIALAAISLLKGYNLKVIIAENASKERIDLLMALGAEIIFVKPEDWRDKAVRFGKKLAEENGWIMLNQYENNANVLAHYTTAKEIISNLELSKIIPDYLIIGIGTGGTITGLAKLMKEKYPSLKVIGILPEDRIEGLRGFAEFKPPILDLSLVDELINVREFDAKESMKELAKKYGLLAGVSSGAAFHLSKIFATKFNEKNIVTLFPDGIEKYLSYI
jgi:cysteine synthase A